MRSKPVAFLLADLGVTKTHSRPYTSTDNPYSEAQFKTMKYRPGFPDRFGSTVHSREQTRAFFNWYNHEHRHSGIVLMTPATVHYGGAQTILGKRTRILDEAYLRNPERFRKRAQTAVIAQRCVDQPTDSRQGGGSVIRDDQPSQWA